MSTTVVNQKSETAKRSFGAEDFKSVCKLYADRKTKRLVDAVSACDNIEQAISKVRTCWDALQSMADNGAGYTPPDNEGWQGMSAQAISLALMGLRPDTGQIRKAVSNFGK